jgi:hypothetical protein
MKLKVLGIPFIVALALQAQLPAAAAPKVIKVDPAKGASRPAAQSPAPALAASPAQPFEIGAHYTISLNGFDLGTLAYNASVKGNTYTADSDVEVSALLGTFKWRGLTRTSGTVANGVHRPQGYSFEFDGTHRSGSVRMAFAGLEVTSLVAKPAVAPAADWVPLERKHLQGALDPLSAILAMSRPGREGPCGRTLAIIDGKQRFDLTLAYRRQEPISGGPDGASVMATVCRVKYSPLAGHRANAETQAMAANNGIEITFRPIPAAGLVVPHRVVIPTMVGEAVIEAARINVSTGSRGEIAQAE